MKIESISWEMLLGLLLFLAAIPFPSACAAADKPASALYQKANLLFAETFTGGLTNWTLEAENNNTVLHAGSGELEILSPGGMSLWFNKKLSGNYMIEYEAKVLDEGKTGDRVSDLNCFWGATDAKHPDFFSKDAVRDGAFASYNILQCYYVGYGGNRNTTTRFRKYDGSKKQGPVITEYTDAAHLLTGNKVYKIQLVVFENRIQYIRDGEILCDYQDASPYKEGYFALRGTENHMLLKNFKVYALQQGRTQDK